LPHEYFHISLYLQCFKGMYLNDDLYYYLLKIRTLMIEIKVYQNTAKRQNKLK
jgi:hypothetical protein